MLINEKKKKIKQIKEIIRGRGEIPIPKKEKEREASIPDLGIEEEEERDGREGTSIKKERKTNASLTDLF